MTPPFFEHGQLEIYHGDCREILRDLPDESVHCCVTSPPYWGLRDYGVAGQIGLEKTPELYVAQMVDVFREVKRVLRKDGTLWLNLGDSYAQGNKGNSGELRAGDKQATNHGSAATRRGESLGPNRNGGTNGFCKPKDLVGIPWLVAFALRADGWYLRQDIIWSKPNPMPESVTDRCTKAHEYLFLLAKSQRYFYNQEAIIEPAAYDGRADTMLKGSPKLQDGDFLVDGNPNSFHARPHERWPNKLPASYNGSSFNNGKTAQAREHLAPIGQQRAEELRGRNKRTVWEIATQPFPEAHFATFPPKLIEPCILAGCPAGGTVLDPFFGAGTTGLVANKLNCKCIGIELNEKYCGEIAAKRLAQEGLNFEQVSS